MGLGSGELLPIMVEIPLLPQVGHLTYIACDLLSDLHRFDVCIPQAPVIQHLKPTNGSYLQSLSSLDWSYVSLGSACGSAFTTYVYFSNSSPPILQDSEPFSLSGSFPVNLQIGTYYWRLVTEYGRT